MVVRSGSFNGNFSGSGSFNERRRPSVGRAGAGGGLIDPTRHSSEEEDSFRDSPEPSREMTRDTNADTGNSLLAMCACSDVSCRKQSDPPDVFAG